jgi:hypothetical protein
MDEGRRQSVGWTDDAGVARRATLPVVVFVRSSEDTVSAAATMVS